MKALLGHNNDIDEDEWDRMINEVEQDDNGEIDFQEFTVMM